MIRFSNKFIRVSFRREDFRVPVAKPFVALVGPALLLIETVVVWPSEANEPASTFLSMAGLLIVCAAVVLMISSRYHVEVGPDGVDFHGIWPRPRHVNWQEVTRTRLLRFFGLECLIMKVPERRTSVWIPLIVQRSDLFLDMVLTYVNADDEVENPRRNISE